MSPWKVILATIIIFASGVVTGGFWVKNLQQPPRPALPSHSAMAKNNGTMQLQRVEFLRKIEKQLNLTPGQQQRIENIMHESQERTKPLWDTIAPKMHVELKRVREAIRAELNPEQQKKFEELTKVRPQRKADEPQHEDRDRRRRKEAATTNASSLR